eukprot:9287304-Prorocentrum_lima.AAC.1
MKIDTPRNILNSMNGLDVLHACERGHPLAMMRRLLGLVGMDVSNSNIWVVAQPCAGLSELIGQKD